MAVCMTTPILVVDDYNTMVRILRNLLRQLGFTNVDEASDGATALSKLKARSYQLVISDWGMAPMNGGELLAQVRADERLKDTPFVMVTGEGRVEADGVVKRAGLGATIVKPFNALALKSKLVSVLGEF